LALHQALLLNGRVPTVQNPRWSDWKPSLRLLALSMNGLPLGVETRVAARRRRNLHRPLRWIRSLGTFPKKWFWITFVDCHLKREAS
jgi:hypothetical protein